MLQSTVPDHCSTFALSDSNEKAWQQKCDHFHADRCDRCELLNETFYAIELCIGEVNNLTIRERLLHRLQFHAKTIREWKAHQLRVVHQDRARATLLKNLDAETVFIYIDWAMKWLPMQYREAQRDFFAKRGLSWHVSYVIRKSNPDLSLQLPIVSQSFSSHQPISSVGASGLRSKLQLLPSLPEPPSPSSYEHKTFIHSFDQCKQNGKTVLSIVHDLFTRLKRELPGVKYAHLRADNAGCYHGSDTLLSTVILHKETGIWIKSIDFCDPQGGKGPCDRMAAVIKCQIRSYINSKNDVTNAAEFCNGAASTNGLEIHSSSVDLSYNDKIELTGISQFNNIEYTEDGIRVWRSWKVGEGKTFKWSTLPKVKSINQLKSLYSPNTKSQWIAESIKKGTSLLLLCMKVQKEYLERMNYSASSKADAELRKYFFFLI